MKALIFLSHKLNEEQLNDLKENYQATPLYLPEELQQKWSNVPPGTLDVIGYALPFVVWASKMQQDNKEGVLAIVQGESTLSYETVNRLKKSLRIKVFAATTERLIIDGRRVFQHAGFREYL